MAQDSIFLQALDGAITPKPPIWFMRQAGRYLPEYRALREKAGSFLDLCFNADLASEVTLQPIERYDLDAAILFADILLIPYAFGQNLKFEAGEGPILDPIPNSSDLERYRQQNIHEHLSPVYETIRKTRAGLASDKALIGFAGAPWTVATYMLNGGSAKDPAALRARYYAEPEFVMALIDLLTEATIEYLIAQIDAGVDAVQLFDSWAGGLPFPVLDQLSIRPLEKIAKAVKEARPQIPVILFPKGVGEKLSEYALIRHADAIGIDFAIDPSWARTHISGLKTVQGGLDPLMVVAGGEAMENAAATYLKLLHDVPYIFNLGHGFTPQTPPEHVQALVDFIRRF